MEIEREVEFSEDDIIDQIDWNQVFDDSPDTAKTLDSPPAMSSSSWIDEIEKVLMKDDEHNNPMTSSDSDFCEHFLADILLDSPDSASTDSDPNASLSPESDNLQIDDNDKGDDVADDPVSKKRRRQLRNRDAAVRSRERKKNYVKDLEMKSKYLESECRRLGRLLQCCYADNQALRFTLHSHMIAHKQESAVLFLESLPLGSLLLWVIIMILSLLPLNPKLHQQQQREIQVEEVARESRIVDSSGSGGHLTFVKIRRRRCKASWPKIKFDINRMIGSFSYVF